MAKEGLIVLDSDMHVMEPHDLWLRYMDARYRNRAPKRRQFPSGLTAWASEGQAFPAYSDHPSRRQQNAARYQRAAAQGERHAEARTRGYDAQSQIKAMDVEGIDMAVCFRTLGSHVIAIDGMDADLSAAMCRAFNRWLAEYCSADTFKLKASAVLPLQDVTKVVRDIKSAARVEYRVDKAGIIHMPIGKVSFSVDQLAENLSTLVSALIKARPTAAKGRYLKKITVSSIMGPGLDIDTQRAQALAEK